MNVLYLLLPIAIFFLIIAIAFFFWAIKNEQYDDMDSPALKIVIDDHQKNKKSWIEHSIDNSINDPSSDLSSDSSSDLSSELNIEPNENSGSDLKG